MTLDLDVLAELNQSGRMLDRKALAELPEPPAPPRGLAERLRDALTADDLGLLLGVVLEDACGLAIGWRKPPALGQDDAEKLLDGTVLKPRWIYVSGVTPVLAVFTDKAERIGLHRGRRGFAHVVEYLRRRQLPVGLVTNGREWRLVFADQDNLAWVEWNADRFLHGDTLHPTLLLLRRVLSDRALAKGEKDAPSALVKAIRRTRAGQRELSSELGENVRRSVEELLRARRGVLDPAWSDDTRKETYEAACRFVMRLVVVLFAEARELLPLDSRVYHRSYGLRGLIEGLRGASADRRRESTSAWPRLLALFRLLHQGSHHPELVLPRYGGELFAQGELAGDALKQALSRIESVDHPPDDETVWKILRLLTRTTVSVREGAQIRVVEAPVDFTELTSEYIGILYEGLLDYELHRVGDSPIVFLGLGDEPALPLDRLEAMDDKRLAALVEKAKVSKKTTVAEEEDSDEDAENEGDDDSDSGADPGEPLIPSAVEGGAAETDAEPDDHHAEALAKARAWAEKAAIAGKLVPAPRGRNGRDDPAWKAKLEKATKTLIADLKLPGELYLVRWGGTRKGAGTFYTRPQLTLPTVRRTLEPLLLRGDGTLKTPEELLSLKVCDPAMGSGSFLVAALRVLTEAVVRSLHEHGRIVGQGQTGEGDLVRLECELMPDADKDQPADHVEAIVRRAVVEHCIYGVDRDELAVELGRVALWVETLDKRLPFTFLDHKLRCGDALVGAWLDRFRDYPLLAWWRQSPDEKYKGVTHQGDTWAKALKERRSAIVAEQADLLSGQLRIGGQTVSDDDLKAAVQRVRELYRRIHSVPAGRPDERARIWTEQVRKDPAYEQVKAAFDLWCALWFWPLDRLDSAPGPLSFASPSAEARETVERLRRQKRFFHWELEFPDVFTAAGSGFDAIVANPPWEVRKPNSKEFFSDRDPLYRAYGKQEGLARQREEFEKDAGFERLWLEYVGGLKDDGNFVRHAGEPFGDTLDENDKPLVSLVPRQAAASRQKHEQWKRARTRRTGLSDPEHGFRHQGSADLNSYKLFVEQGHALLGNGGQLGLITPSGLYTDKGSRELRQLLLDRCEWRWLYGFENRNKVFDIHRSFKFAVSIAQKGGRTEAISASFMRHEIEDWAQGRGALPYPAERIRAFSPKSLSVLEIRSEADLEVLTKIYANSVLLGDDGPNGWGIKYAREFDMTNDSKLFVGREKAEADGYRADEYGRWIGPEGEVLLPLYEGRMIGQFDFSEKGWVSGKGRSAEWREVPWDRKVIEPQFLMAFGDYTSARDKDGNPKASRGLKLGFMDVSSATNRRTTVAGLSFDMPHGNKVPLLRLRDERDAAALCGVLDSFVYDFGMRSRLGGLTLNYFIVEETAVPPHSQSRAWRNLRSLGLSLAGVHQHFAPAWAGFITKARAARPWRSLWAITPHERLRLRAILDAIVATLYGLSRDDFAWILRDCDWPTELLSDRAFCRPLDPKGFWRVDKVEPPERRHTVLSLVAFDALSVEIANAGGDRDQGIEAFCALNDGDGWMLPDTLRLKDHGLGHDARAEEAQPCATALGPRFLDWQLAQTPEESWAECERHAKAILGEAEFERRFGAGAGVEKPPEPPKGKGKRKGTKQGALDL